MTNTKEEWLRRLDGDAAQAEQAATELLTDADRGWMRGTPPPGLVRALLQVSVTYDAESAIFELGRAWDRESLGLALMAALRGLQDPVERTHAGWLFKHLGSATVWADMAALAQSDREATQTRRWQLEGLDRLAFGRVVGWAELRDLVRRLRSDPLPAIREGVVGVLMSLPSSDEKTDALLDLLEDANADVLASALAALDGGGAQLAGIGLERVRSLASHRLPKVGLAAQALLDQHRAGGADG